MAKIVGVSTAVPPFAVRQEEAKAAAQLHFSGNLSNTERYVTVFDNAGVKCRYFAVPLDWFREPHELAERNRAAVEWATRLCKQAIEDCMEATPFEPDDIDHIVFVSSSCIATPSVDAHLINELGLSGATRRSPIFGLGCAGGAMGLSHAGLLANAAPSQKIMLVAVELNSLTFQYGDYTKGNFVASSLFSDGAAAVLVCSDDVAADGPRIVGTQSAIWPNTMDVMGWEFKNTGFSVIFGAQIPKLVVEHMASTVDGLLDEMQIKFSDITHHVFHPGGAKVLDAYKKALSLEDDHLRLSTKVLEQYGNMSSPTVLFILKEFFDQVTSKSREFGLCAAFGPGFTAELLLLEW